MPGAQWGTCPVCGYSAPGMTNGPCSAKCSAKQRQDNAMGREREPVQQKYGGAGKRSTDKKGGCGKIVLLPPAVAFGVAIATSLLRRNR